MQDIEDVRFQIGLGINFEEGYLSQRFLSSCLGCFHCHK